MKEYKTPVIEEVNGDNAISDVFESWEYCKAYVDRALAELSQYRLTGMTPGEIAEMRRDVNKMHGGWIPVEKRLPEKGERVLCFFEFEPISPNVICENGYIGSGIWLSEGDKVVAWRPLPEPYSPERSNDAKE